MKPWSRNEPIEDADVSGTTQFEGRTAEEAVAHARAALGDAGALRCWKTRRGGVGGFFAKEVFVAGLTPPPGSETTRSKASRLSLARREAGPTAIPSPVQRPMTEPYGRPAKSAGAARTSRWAGGPSLGVGRSHVRSGVLAVAGDPGRGVRRGARRGAGGVDTRARGQWRHHSTRTSRIRARRPPPRRSRVSPSKSPHCTTTATSGSRPTLARPRSLPAHRVARRIGERPASAPPAKKAPRPKPKAGRTPPAPRSTPAAKHEQRSRPARIPDLRPGLRSLGVPDSYLPRGQRPSLDQLAAVMGTLPVSPALPTRTGAVVAVVASEPNLDRTVDLLTAELSLGQRDVLRFGGSPGAARLRSADLTSAEGARLGRQIARRRASGRTSLLAVDAAPGVPLGRDVARAPRAGGSRLCPGGGRRALQEGGCRALGR